MEHWDRGLLEPAQLRFAESHLARPALVSDMSWGQVDTRVLRVRTRDGDVVVKAAGPGNHHIGREITGYEEIGARLAAQDRAGRLVASDRAANALIVRYQPGVLAEGTVAELSPAFHRQAGEVLREIHAAGSRIDDDVEARATARALAWFDEPHRIDPSAARRARALLERWRPRPVEVVPTHGDWQPRNWLADGDRLRVIDLGRFAHRPRLTDFARLAAQQWRTDSALERAFLDGYGDDPRERDLWRIERLREAVGTAAWAFRVGDTAFEQQGHRMIAEALDAFD